MNWYYWVLIIIVTNWVACFVGGWLYILWLWKVSHDISFKGWIWWKGWFPIGVFKLISTESWYAKLWRNWCGFALFGSIIYKYGQDEQSKENIEYIIVHELQHNLQLLVLGLVFYVIYAADLLYRGYYDMWLERNAVDAQRKWKEAGKPKIFTTK